MTPGKLLLFAFAGGCMLLVIIVAFVFATGSTFGQRCERLYPGASPAEYERCVDRLSHGVPA